MTSVTDGPPMVRRSMVTSGASALRSSAIPVIQLGSAAITLGLWLVVNQQVSAEYEVLVVKVFSYSAVLALTITAGIAYVLPNLFRSADRSTWAGPGGWSSSLAVAIALNRGFAVTGAVLGLVAVLVPGLLVVAATFGASAVLSTALLTAQLARLQDSRWGMAVALSPNPFIPLAFLLIHGLGVPLAWAAALFCLAALALDEAVVRRYRPMAASLGDLDRTATRSTVSAAGPLIPHLLCFAAIMQGPRLMQAVSGSESTLVASHQVMLLVAIGTTVVTSFHGYISVSLQSTSDEAYPSRLRAFGLQYAAIGALASLAVAVLLILVAPSWIAGFPDLTWPARVAVISALPIIATYYALSAQLVRAGRTALLAVVSASTLALYLLIEVLAPASSASESFVRYAVCLLAMPLLLWGVASLVAPSLRVPLTRLLGTAALGFVPLGVIIVIASFASAGAS